VLTGTGLKATPRIAELLGVPYDAVPILSAATDIHRT